MPLREAAESGPNPTREGVPLRLRTRTSETQCARSNASVGLIERYTKWSPLLEVLSNSWKDFDHAASDLKGSNSSRRGLGPGSNTHLLAKRCRKTSHVFCLKQGRYLLGIWVLLCLPSRDVPNSCGCRFVVFMESTLRCYGCLCPRQPAVKCGAYQGLRCLQVASPVN